MDFHKAHVKTFMKTLRSELKSQESRLNTHTHATHTHIHTHTPHTLTLYTAHRGQGTGHSPHRHPTTALSGGKK